MFDIFAWKMSIVLLFQLYSNVSLFDVLTKKTKEP